MYIKEIAVKNFKSFKELKWELRALNVVVGANAAGKTNLTTLFRFIQNIAIYGLQDAISLETGTLDLLTNINLDQKLSVRIVFGGDDFQKKNNTRNDGLMLKLRAIYQFEIIITPKSVEIIKDDLFVDFLQRENSVHVITDEALGISTGKKLHYQYSQRDGKLEFADNSNGSGVLNDLAWHLPYETVSKIVIPDDPFLMLQLPYFQIFLNETESPFAKMKLYDIDLSPSKGVVSIKALNQLESDAKNLVPVLNRLLADEDKRRTLLRLTQYFLPFADEISVNSFANGLILMLRENLNERPFPAFALSDGTLYVLALIVALHFEGDTLAIFEEPEKHIHPSLLSSLMEFAYEVSQRKQLILTTHHPQIVRYTKLEDLILVSRDKNGFSQIVRPHNSERVKI